MTPPKRVPDDALHEAARLVADEKVAADTKVADAKSDSDAALIEALREFVESRSAIEDVVTLMQQQQEHERIAASRRRKRGWVAAGIAFIILVAVVVVLGLIGTAQSRSNHKAIQKTSQVFERLNECTTPGTKAHPHKCYEDGQAGTATAVATLIQTQIKASAYAVECVLGGRSDVEACVNERFAGGERPPVQKQSTIPSATTTTTAPRRRTAAPSRSPVTTSTTTTTTQPKTFLGLPITPPTTTTSTTVDPCEVKLLVFCLQVPPQ